MEKDEVIKNLKEYNAWRRGDEGFEMPLSVIIGVTIDEAIRLLEEDNKKQPIVKVVG